VAPMHSPQATESEVTVRLALGDEESDRTALRHLADRSGGTLPNAPFFFAEVAGWPVAAIGLTDGSVVADPLVATTAIILLLHMRRFEARVIGSIWGA
jgi:hypothetical protein